jgi:hypothetical protein
MISVGGRRNWWQLYPLDRRRSRGIRHSVREESRPLFSDCSTAYALVSAVTHKAPPEAAVHSPLLRACVSRRQRRATWRKDTMDAILGSITCNMPLADATLPYFR